MGRPLSNSPAGLSLWHETADDDGTHRRPLPGDTQADVAVVGAGFTGLWTAYYLLRADPGISVVVLEAEKAGFGASGRNGGWCSALFPTTLPRLATLSGGSREAALAQHRAMRATVDEVLTVLDREAIDAHAHKGGTVTVARNPAQLARARAETRAARDWGRGPDELRLLDAEEARSRLDAEGVLGGTFTPDCAALHPARLARGLARVVEGLGARVHEDTRVLGVEPGAARTEHGTVRAEVVVRATEGYTGTLAGQRRCLVPIYSLIVATAPLPPETWARIGLADRETFTDGRHLVVYGQRTADDRLVFGGRGAPYHFGSRTRSDFDRDPRVFDRLRRDAAAMLPGLAGARFTHEWGGALGVPRDWCASVGLDRRSGLGWAGGYVGDGVATSNLAGRTLRDLVLGRDSELARLPWVDHRSPAWEREPLRWAGVNLGLRAAALADIEEQATGRPSRIGRITARLTGRV